MSIHLEIMENGVIVELNESSIDVAIQQQTIDVFLDDGISIEIALGAVVFIPGRGMPTGGMAGQFLGKNSDGSFDNAWKTIPFQAAADEAQAAAESYADAGDSDTLIESKSYIDEQIAPVRALAETNQLNISQCALDSDLIALGSTVTDQGILIADKANQSALDVLQAFVDTLPSHADITAVLDALVGTAPSTLNTIYELAAALQGEQAVVDTLTSAIGNRLRVDSAQGLNSIQQAQGRANLNAEAVGVAASLIAAITPGSIGAATAAQGSKADTALQSSDVAPVALSGSFMDLVNKSGLFGLIYSAYTLGTNAVIAATDTLGQMLGKLQAQINANVTAIASKQPVVSFAQARGGFYDFDSTVQTFFGTSAINGGSANGTSGLDNVSAGTLGIYRYSSSTTANSGYMCLSNVLNIIGAQGLMIHNIFRLVGGAPTRITRIGFHNSVSSADATNGVYFEIADSTVVAKTATSGTRTSQGSTVLSTGIWLVANIEYLTSGSVRFVISDLQTPATKYFDQTISTTVPNQAANPMQATFITTSGGTSVIVLADHDFIGMWPSRPSWIVTPA